MYKALTDRMEVLINRVEKTEYALQILEKLKLEMDEDKKKEMEADAFDEVERLDQQLERANLLLNWLAKNRYSLEAE